MNLSCIWRDQSRMTLCKRTALSILALATLASPAVAQTVTAIETELVKGRCKFIDDDGEVGHYALKRCPGLGGARVYTTAGVHDVALSFKWGRKESEVFSSGSIGLKLEWRGVKGKQGFKPHAVVVQRTIKDHRKDEKHNVWAVIRIEPHNACQIAVIDGGANPDALGLARTTADYEAPAVSCAKVKAKIVGVTSQWAQEAIGLDEPPKQ
jgi:hypothetical protein